MEIYVFMGLGFERTEIGTSTGIPLSYLNYRTLYGANTNSFPLTLGWSRALYQGGAEIEMRKGFRWEVYLARQVDMDRVKELKALDLKGKERVLEIGTGSGYQAAVLAECVARVYTIEIVRPFDTGNCGSQRNRFSQ